LYSFFRLKSTFSLFPERFRNCFRTFPTSNYRGGKYFCFNPTASSTAIPSSIAASTALLLAVPLLLLPPQHGLKVRAAPDPHEAGGGERLVGSHDQMQRERGVGRRQREAGLRVRPAGGESINSSILTTLKTGGIVDTDPDSFGSWTSIRMTRKQRYFSCFEIENFLSEWAIKFYSRCLKVLHVDLRRYQFY
jgi:hypothetical protein